MSQDGRTTTHPLFFLKGQLGLQETEACIIIVGVGEFFSEKVSYVMLCLRRQMCSYKHYVEPKEDNMYKYIYIYTWFSMVRRITGLGRAHELIACQITLIQPNSCSSHAK